MQLLKAEIQKHGEADILAALVQDDDGNLATVVVNLNRPTGRTEETDGTLIVAAGGVDPADDWRQVAGKVAGASLAPTAPAAPPADSTPPGGGDPA